MSTLGNRRLTGEIMSGENAGPSRRALAEDRRLLAKARAAEREAGEMPKTLRKSILAEMAADKLPGPVNKAAASTVVGQSRSTKGTPAPAAGLTLDGSEVSDGPKQKAAQPTLGSFDVVQTEITRLNSALNIANAGLEYLDRDSGKLLEDLETFTRIQNRSNKKPKQRTTEILSTER